MYCKIQFHASRFNPKLNQPITHMAANGLFDKCDTICKRYIVTRLGVNVGLKEE